MNELTIRVTGMTCASCVASVESIVSNIDGIESVRVNLPLEKATIKWAEGADKVAYLRTSTRNDDLCRNA